MTKSLGIYYGWVCHGCFHSGNYWETTIPSFLIPPFCIVCGEKPAGKFHQVSAEVIVAIFAAKAGKP